MTMSRRLGVAVVPFLLLAAGCSSAARSRDRALVDASYEIQKTRTGQTYDEVRLELETFRQTDIAEVRERAILQRDRELALYRKIWLAGSGAAIAAGAAAGKDFAKVGGAGLIGVALGGFAFYTVRVNEMKDCEAFLDRSEEQLRAWGTANLRPGSDPVPPALWQDYLARTAAIERFEKCARARP